MKRSDFRLTRRNVIQFLKYAVGGSLYFVSGYIVFAVLYSGFGWDWVPAKMLADLIGWTLNYLVQRFWAFDNKALEHHEAATVGRFTLLSLLNLAIDYLIIWALNSVGVSPYIGFFISSAFFTVWNYLWYRFWVFFRKNKDHNGGGEAL
jgi:putative flippase GtrA